jgi:hypothetical protein
MSALALVIYAPLCLGLIAAAVWMWAEHRVRKQDRADRERARWIK